MKVIKSIIISILLIGGLLLGAASCEAWSLIGMAIGLALIGAGVGLSNLWKDEVSD